MIQNSKSTDYEKNTFLNNKKTTKGNVNVLKNSNQYIFNAKSMPISVGTVNKSNRVLCVNE